MARARTERAGAIDQRRFHRWLARTQPKRHDARLTIGDDVAEFRAAKGRWLLTTDAFSEGTHFVPGSRPVSVGRALVEVNLSDLASKGAEPRGFLLDLLVRPGTDERWARGVVRGVRAALAPYGVELSGGDTKPGAGRSLVGTAIGWSGAASLPGRNGARPGDRVVITGRVGAGGLAALGLDGSAAEQARAVRALLRVRGRVAEGRVLARAAHAMIDTSDGLFESARLIAEASRVQLRISVARIPLVHSLLRQFRDPAQALEAAGYGGDYELLATVPADRLPAVRDGLRRLRCPLTEIGTVRAGRGAVLADVDGAVRSMPVAGWDPFRRTRAGRGGRRRAAARR